MCLREYAIVSRYMQAETDWLNAWDAAGDPCVEENLRFHSVRSLASAEVLGVGSVSLKRHCSGTQTITALQLPL